jgi:PhzF family phenazine biosynthesis protein
MTTTIPLYQLDAFADRPFAGNPAAVCPLDAWPPDDRMQAIAAENNLSETAFFVRRPDGDYDLRWFTPAIEVDLCGHATLASAHVVLNRLTPDARSVTFHTRSGPLTVARDGDRLVMDFPAQPPAPGAVPGLAEALGAAPAEVQVGRYAVAVFDDAAAVAALEPDFRAIARLDPPFVVATAPGDDCDFVSRFFAPSAGVDEDPVTGSAHCILIPFWAERLGKAALFARQISRRGGALWCRHDGDRVTMAGHCAPYLEGRIEA